MFLQPFAGFVLIFAGVLDLAQSHLLGVELPRFAEPCQFPRCWRAIVCRPGSLGDYVMCSNYLTKSLLK